MAKKIGTLSTFVGGIADSIKLGIPYSFAWARNIDFRSNPSQFTINPKSEKQTGSLVTDLPMWADIACSNLYFYGDSGNIYQKDINDEWTLEHTAPNSSGNGLVYFPEDNYLYYAQDKTIGRRSTPCTTGTYYDGFLESEGGEPTNSYSITFASASSQYASIADNASLSITNDISMEAYIKFTSLPGTNEVQTLISKWNENSNQRSYKFDVTTSSNYFGDGRDGALTISSNTTEDPVDANCTGTSGAYTLTITNAHASFSSLASGDKVLIWQTRGTNAGTYQIATVSSYSAGTLTLQEALTFSPAHSSTASVANKAQVRLLKQYTNVTVNNGITYTAKAWSESTGKGGVLGFFANGTVTVSGTITASNKGFAGGNTSPSPDGSGSTNGVCYTGESSTGTSVQQHTVNGMGGGGGRREDGLNGSSGAGGGGGYGASGTTGAYKGNSSYPGIGGSSGGATDISSLFLGAGGGGGSNTFSSNATYPNGGWGGGALTIFGATITGAGTLSANGQAGNTGTSSGAERAGGGGGSGGSILLRSVTATLSSMTVTATGGSGGAATDATGGAGAVGRSHLDYATSYTLGTSSPTVDVTQNSLLGNTTGYILRLLISSTGSNTETYSWDITDILQTGTWSRWAVTWTASTSTALFYRNGALLGQRTGALTAIFNSTARFALATSYDSSGNPHDYFNGKMDDARVWNDVRTATELVTYNDRVLAGTDPNLVAYYKFEQNVNDSQTYTATSNLTATNSPTYSTDIPFSGLTSRLDQDVTINSTGSTYTLGTSLSEASTARRTFQPTKEPIKSLSLKIDTIGTGNWTVVVHDALNREMASVTVANAQLTTGEYEFRFSSSFRPVLTANYHVHVYDTTGDGKIVTSSLNNMEGSTVTSTTTGAFLNTFYQILVDDEYHPMIQFGNFVAIGNERYVAKLEAGNIYNPHQLTLPAGYRVRCFAILNEYLAIGVWKGTSITDTDQGKIFLWDGSSDTSGNSSPNYIIDVLEGGVNSMRGAGGILSLIAGYKGKLLQYGAYGLVPQTQKVKQLPFLDADEYCEVAPGAMAMWQSLLYIGGPLNTDSSTLHNGIYSYGRLNHLYPDSLGFDELSIGDQTSSMVKVGCVFPQGQDLYVGWQNGNVYGIDRVRTTNEPYATATIELLVTAFGDMSQLKQPVRLRSDFDSLVTGQTITHKYKPNRQASWFTLGSEDTVGAQELSLPINQLNREIQCAVDITCSTTSPTIYQISLENDQIPSPV